MADLADSIDDLICTFDANIDYEMDTLAMFLFGWILTALFILWLSKAIYNRFILKESSSSSSKTDTVKSVVTTTNSENKQSGVKQLFSGKSSGGGGGVSGAVGGSLPQAPLRKRISRKSSQSPVPDFKKPLHYYPAPQCTGPDNIAVLWVNDVFQWLYNDLVILNELLTEWLRSMNEFSKQTLEEVFFKIFYCFFL